MIFILKCDSCDERVVLDESHVDSGLRLVIPNRPIFLASWREVECEAKQLNGEKRYGMTKHMCPACAGRKGFK